MSLTNPNKPVTEARLQEFYHRIKNFLGFTEMPSEDMSEVISPLPSVMSRRFKYSTEEQIVGEWIDGKPIYQKTLSVINKSLSSGDNTIIDDSSFPSISTLISISLINYSPNHNTYHDVVRMYPNTAWTGGINYISTSNGLTIVYNIGSNYANEGPFNIYVTIQYTKTTD